MIWFYNYSTYLFYCSDDNSFYTDSSLLHYYYYFYNSIISMSFYLINSCNPSIVYLYFYCSYLNCNEFLSKYPNFLYSSRNSIYLRNYWFSYFNLILIFPISFNLPPYFYFSSSNYLTIDANWIFSSFNLSSIFWLSLNIYVYYNNPLNLLHSSI